MRVKRVRDAVCAAATLSALQTSPHALLAVCDVSARADNLAAPAASARPLTVLYGRLRRSADASEGVRDRFTDFGKRSFALVSLQAASVKRACSCLSIVQLANGPKRSMGHFLGAEKGIFLLRGRGRPTVYGGRTSQNLSIPAQEVSLGSPRVGTIHVQAPASHTPSLQAFLADFSQHDCGRLNSCAPGLFTRVSRALEISLSTIYGRGWLADNDALR